MDANILNPTIHGFLTAMHERLAQALTIAKAAEACAASGSAEKAIDVSMDIEQLLYEASTLLNAASLINRILRS